MLSHLDKKKNNKKQKTSVHLLKGTRILEVTLHPRPLLDFPTHILNAFYPHDPFGKWKLVS